jgi:hypothetical protein
VIADEAKVTLKRQARDWNDSQAARHQAHQPEREHHGQKERQRAQQPGADTRRIGQHLALRAIGGAASKISQYLHNLRIPAAERAKPAHQ